MEKTRKKKGLARILEKRGCGSKIKRESTRRIRGEKEKCAGGEEEDVRCGE